jgi:glycine/D-amino acid oxidase-like deaminating enzyme
MTAGEPWWGRATGLSAADLPATADIVVIGGGILGLATAYWLARGGHRPVLLEQEGLGAGASGRNGGFLPVGTAEDYDRTVDRLGRAGARELLSLTLENRRLASQLIEEEGIACDFRPAGHLHLALDAEEHAANQRLGHLLTEDGTPVDHLDRRETGLLVHTGLGPRIAGGLWFRDIGLVHSGKLLAGLGVAAARRGAILVRARVTRLQVRANQSVVETDRGTIGAGRLVVATNAWLEELIPTIKGLVRPVRGQALAFAPVRRLFDAGMTALVTATEEYWQQTIDGSIILGGCRAVRPDRDEGILGTGTTGDVQSALERVLPMLFPDIGPLRVTHRWAGPMAFTPDRLPILTRLPVDAGWAAGGFSGHGMSLTMVLSRGLAALVAGGPADPRFEYFSPQRFPGSSA